MTARATLAAARSLALTLALTALGGAGCASTKAANRALVYPERTAVIEVLNPGLQDEVEIVSGRALYEDELLTGVVQLRSHEEERKLTLEYRWSWFDGDDFEQVTEVSDHWRTIFLDPMEEEQVSARATAPGAVRGVFELRRSTARTDGDH